MRHEPNITAAIGHSTHFLPDCRAVVTWRCGANGPGKVIFAPRRFLGLGRARWTLERVKKCDPPATEVAEALAVLQQLAPDCRAPA